MSAGCPLHVASTAASGCQAWRSRGNDHAALAGLRVKAVADRGKANEAVIALLAKALDVPKNAIRLVSGDTARLKTVAVTGDVATLVRALEGLVAGST